MPTPYEEAIIIMLGSFQDSLRVTLVGHLANIYMQGSGEVVEWGRTKLTDRPIFYEGPPIAKALDYAEKHCAKLVTQIDKETQARLAKVIKDGISNKRGVPGLARDIRKEITDMSKYRSQLISRTETCDALQQGFMDRAKDLGISGKEWVVTEPCPICSENGAAGPIPINQEFPSGHMRPPAHPNCRCALAPVMIK